MSEKLTPMMQQYFEVKRGLPANTLLLFRLGDFYEMFFEDAEVGARLLGITLTRRQDYPMAGIPFHAADNYVNKLLAAGRKVTPPLPNRPKNRPACSRCSRDCGSRPTAGWS